ncbi:hypothetical protein QJU43_04570 [Pasteurella atlantica]|uniref:Lipoprotein with Yx(FWY)xxD motif n=3 Tax=Pasteurellaceae TaxID=712 RepID=A0AAJ6P1N4_9PAST|nr:MULTISPECIES: hypothetical protein [Pasteurella]MDP8033601.1 hypothetical protein [Pasteurella atlantica]MDP8035619.1 hypothetical protein [Pasteurella atlantica]MDP8037570.1 hypothetical protein [Pasteurella atlantica]MDP8047919.1 hypothetical protein [Pasteurella atlantica]MDP8049874.1 hypothetical protein [Pasteurella atlantica]
MKKLLLTSVLLASVTMTSYANTSDNASSVSQNSTQSVPVSTLNGLLTDKNGMTLYTFDKDIANSGKSVCNDECAIYWPPLFAKDNAINDGDYSVIIRDDGKKQWAFKGKPLYYWIKDKKVGDTTGDGFRNIWRIVKP